MDWLWSTFAEAEAVGYAGVEVEKDELYFDTVGDVFPTPARLSYTLRSKVVSLWLAITPQQC